MTAYYNEIDPYAAQWLRNLISAGHIAPGYVDCRSVTEVGPGDLDGYSQCHFFAGIGGWSAALRLAGWSDDRSIWTASVPCQPFSVASVAHGGAKGQGDERDHWPDFFRLVRERRPTAIFGEQVANAVQWGWWDRAALQLEAETYACAAAILRADSCRARHQRRRLYWLANAGSSGRPGHQPIEVIPVAAIASSTIDGDPLAGAGRALDGDYSGLLPGDGLSVALERARAKGYGNAIVPQVAAEFVSAYMEIGIQD